MSDARALKTTKLEDWVARQTVVFDWYDGPKHGVCALAVPAIEFVFDLLAERYNADGIDDRLFRLRILPDGSVKKILSSVSALGSPSSAVWIPVWQFDTEAEKQRADSEIDMILASAQTSDLILWTQDMQTFLGLWDEADIQAAADLDWFSRLKI